MTCATCSNFNLTAEDFIVGKLDRDSFYDAYHELGTVAAIRARASTCPLCLLILQAVQLEETSTDSGVEAAPCTLYWQEDGFTERNDEQLGPYMRFLRVSVPGWSIDGHEFHRICLLADDAPAGTPKLFLGRLVPKKINIRRVKRWIRACDRKHACQIEQYFGKVPRETFRLIDVREQCITGTVGRFPSYLALSYVWGKSSSSNLRLLNANEESLRLPGAFKQVWYQMPRTIRDAIKLTSSLGYHYLWVDSLCIIQDNGYDKATNISSMRAIYSRAAVTIVAATGDDSCAGLPGLGHTARSHHQNTSQIGQGLHLLSPVHLTDGLDRTTYDTRGWTYQERIMSARCLFFLEGQVIFKCRRAVLREDISLEDPSVSSCSDLAGYRFMSGFGDVDLAHLYAGCLWEYSTRKLSFEEDRVSAFLGILDLIIGISSKESRVDWKSATAGLPLQYFEWALLWDPAKPLRRHSSALWPSWSWTGWQGQVAQLVSLDSTEALNWHVDRSFIEWSLCRQTVSQVSEVTLDTCESLPCTEGLSRRGALKIWSAFNLRTQLPQPGISIATGPITDSTVREALQISSHMLAFKTFWTKSQLRPVGITRGPWRGYYICTPDGLPYGKLFMEATWQCPSDASFEFIAISEAKSSTIGHIELPKVGADVNDTEWDSFHVLMLHYPRHSKVAERLALGVALQKTFFEGDVEWREIWLG